MGLFDQVLGSVLSGLAQPQGGGQTQGAGNAPANAILIAIASAAARQMTQGGGTAAGVAPGQAGGSLGNVIGTAIGGALEQGLANAMHAQAPPGTPAAPGTAAIGTPAPGGLGSILTSLGGSAALGALVDQFTRNGHGDLISSWIQSGPNPGINPGQLAQALGPETVQALSQRTGIDVNSLLAQLSHELPAAVDQMTPDGRLPTDHEIHASVGAPVS